MVHAGDLGDVVVREVKVFEEGGLEFGDFG